MIKSINDMYRERIVSLESSESIIDYLKKLTINQRNYIFRLMLSDLHKMKIFKILIGSSIDESILMPDNKIAYSIDYKNPVKVFEDSIEATKDFHNLDLITKINLFDLLDSDRIDSMLSMINRLHILDKCIYKFTYGLEEFVDYYYDYIIKNINDDYFAIDFLVDKTESLKEINYEKYKKFILEFIRGFYKNSIYEGVDYNTNYQKYISLINNMSIKELLNEIENDIVFLSAILEEYLKYSISKEKEEIDKYFYKNTEENLQKKLRLI